MSPKRRTAELIKIETSEHRSLVLMNPDLGPQRSTASTLYVAYRVNDPVEFCPRTATRRLLFVVEPF